MAGGSEAVTPEEVFDGDPVALAIHDEIRRTLLLLDGVRGRVSRSQVGFRRDRAFAMLWCPGRYVASDVLSVALPRALQSARVKQVVHPSAGTWMNHLELRDVADVDDEVRGWLVEAWAAATVTGHSKVERPASSRATGTRKGEHDT
ncbi:hypothetical protein ASH02_01220 [Nocardioides sp. Soil796]|nr:hypothetical protein ASH02_01220 [Nocardioides sp. Soil796]